MPQCEMCGAERPSLTTTKVEGAELDLCDDCTDFGTEVRTEDSGSTSTKYSTSSSGGTDDGSGSGSSTGSGGGSSGSRRRDMFDDMDEIATDYDRRLRAAREDEGLSQEDLADALNEKVSLIRKLERGEMLPPDDVRGKLERHLEISLLEGVDADDDEWAGGSSTETTLGDVVKRKD